MRDFFRRMQEWFGDLQGPIFQLFLALGRMLLILLALIFVAAIMLAAIVGSIWATAWLLGALLGWLGFWGKFLGLLLAGGIIVSLVGLVLAIWRPTRVGRRIFFDPRRHDRNNPQTVDPDISADPVEWFSRVVVNNDWLFYIPLFMAIFAFMRATSVGAGDGLLVNTIRDLGNFFGSEIPESTQGTWIWWQLFLVCFFSIFPGAALAFWDEIVGAIRRAVDSFRQRQTAAAQAAAARQPQRGQPTAAGPGPHHAGFLIWEAILDFFPAFLAEYAANRVANRRLL